MNTTKLLVAYNCGQASQYIDTLSAEQRKQLAEKLKIDLDIYRDVCKNYPHDKYERFALPYIRTREYLIAAITLD